MHVYMYTYLYIHMQNVYVCSMDGWTDGFMHVCVCMQVCRYVGMYVQLHGYPYAFQLWRCCVLLPICSDALQITE